MAYSLRKAIGLEEHMDCQQDLAADCADAVRWYWQPLCFVVCFAAEATGCWRHPSPGIPYSTTVRIPVAAHCAEDCCRRSASQAPMPVGQHKK